MNGRRLKALFITHDTSTYGASRSLQALLRNLDNVDIDLVVLKHPLRTFDPVALRAWFGGHVRTIQECYLPYDFCITYRRDSTLLLAALRTYAAATWAMGRSRLERIMREGAYDLVHLNSLVLHEIITPAFPFILHVRDIFDCSNPRAFESLRNARGVIFIDEATRHPFRDLQLKNSIVLNNPFDMTPVAGYSEELEDGRDIDARKHTIISMIGVVSERKGAEFVIRSFMDTRNDDLRLLIVGGRETAYIRKYRALARNDRRIVFWGEEPDIMRIYRISDYIVRGEPYHCIGRTIYEGLYAGCRVIIPGTDKDRSNMFEYDTFQDGIFVYEPANRKALSMLFHRVAGKKVNERTYRSNIPSYVARFLEFVNTAIGRTPANTG